MDNEAGKIAVCWRNHVYIDTPTACSGEGHLTDGASRTVKIGNREIILKRTTPRNMASAGRISGLVIQALRYLGKEHVDDSVIQKLEHRLDKAACEQLMKDIRYAPVWIADIFRLLAERMLSA